ncbi:MAG: OmpA family protein [Pirellulales bacterium]|nr:OmpA family protein [Pirellulales bacterium]
MGRSDAQSLGARLVVRGAMRAGRSPWATRALGHAPAVAVLGLLALASGGCLAPQSRVDALTTQNRALSEQNRAQLAEIENLKIHGRNIENQLRRTEEELALIDDGVGSDGQRLADFRRQHEAIKEQLRGGPMLVPPAVGGQLAAISREHPELKFDPRTGIAKLDTDILFDSGQDDLKPGAEKVLADLAKTLKRAEAEGLRVMVVGHTDDRAIAKRSAREQFPTNLHLSTARALAVARRLRELGVAQDQMGVAGFGSHQPIAPNSSEQNRRANRRVELFVMAPNVPVVGWTETIPTVY